MSLLANQPPRILIVDDEPANLKVMRQVLQEHYRLSFARSGQDALALLEQESVDLVLMDIMMPEMTGFEVCEQLKANAATAAIPVIFVTLCAIPLMKKKGLKLVVWITSSNRSCLPSSERGLKRISRW